MNADAVQTEGEGSNESENEIKNARTQIQSVKTVSPKSNSSGDIGNSFEEECGICGEEGVAAKIQKIHELPSEEEVEIHNATHIPYRSWCPYCVKGKAVAGKHVKQKGQENEVSTVSMDYFYFIKAEEESERGPPSIAIIDSKYGMLRSAVLKQKGVEEWSIKVVKNFIDILGYRK